MTQIIFYYIPLDLSQTKFGTFEFSTTTVLKVSIKINSVTLEFHKSHNLNSITFYESI